MADSKWIRWSVLGGFELLHLIVAWISYVKVWTIPLWVTLFPVMVSDKALIDCHGFFCGPSITGFVVSLLVWATPYYWIGRLIESKATKDHSPLQE